MEDIQEIVVESIDSSKFDGDSISFDEEGKVISAFDPGENKRYVVKGHEAVKTEEKIDDKVEDKTESVKTEDKTEGKTTEEVEEEEYENAAHYVLKKIGYDKDEVDFGEEGGKVKISELNPEQQLDIVISEFDNQIEAYEAKIKELESKTPEEIKFTDPKAQQIVDYLKNGGDLQKLAKEIISRDPAAQAKIMTDVEVVKASIKKEFPEFTDEDIEDEVKDLTPEKIARRAKSLRAKMEKEGPSFQDLTDAQKQVKEQEIVAVKKAFQDEVIKFKETASKIKDIAGLPVTDQIRNYVISKTVPKDYDQDSDFVTKLQGNPEKIFRLEYLDTYFEKILEGTKDFYFKQGLAEGNKGKEKLSDEPVRTYGSSKGKAEIKKDISIEKDFDKWLNSIEF